MKTSTSRKPHSGFTFIELMVTLTIITALTIVGLKTLAQSKPKSMITNLAQQIKSAIEISHSKSIAVSANKDGKPISWGVYLDIQEDNNRIIISPYQPTGKPKETFNPDNINGIQIINIPPKISVSTSLKFTNPQNPFIIFSKLKGNPQLYKVNPKNHRIKPITNFSFKSNDLYICVQNSDWRHILSINSAGTVSLDEIQNATAQTNKCKP